MRSNLKFLLVFSTAVCAAHMFAQAPGQQTFIGPITVDVDGRYPAGYQPHWDFVERGQDIPLITTVVGAKRQNTSPNPWNMGLEMIEGEPTLVFPVLPPGELRRYRRCSPRRHNSSGAGTTDISVHQFPYAARPKRSTRTDMRWPPRVRRPPHLGRIHNPVHHQPGRRRPHGCRHRYDRGTPASES